MKIDDNEELSLIGVSNQKYKKMYLSVLKAGQEYDYSESENVEFEYTYDKNDIALLKETYNIDSLRDKTEVGTLINATNWVSSILKSDDMPRGPIGNSVTIIKNVQEGKNAANCYAHAVVLNDVICALGFKGKYVFCFPIDVYPVDCHVVNLVYSNEKNKWILLDSANNVYFSDRDGNILDIEELRNYLVGEKEIDVNLLKRYDNIGHIEKHFIREKILTYMTKNMYRFGCYRNSQKDGKAIDTNVTFIHLVPVVYMKDLISMVEYSFEKRVKKTEHYITNAQAFWCMPKNVIREDDGI